MLPAAFGDYLLEIVQQEMLMSHSIQSISHTIPSAVAATGISRSRLYELAKAKQLKFLKIGRRTYVADEDLRGLVNRLREEADHATA